MISLYLMVSKCPTLPVLGLLWSSSIRTRFLYPSGVVSRHWQLPRQALSTAYPLQTLHHLHLAGFLWFLLFVLWGFMGDLVCKAGSVEGAVGPSVATRDSSLIGSPLKLLWAQPFASSWPHPSIKVGLQCHMSIDRLCTGGWQPVSHVRVLPSQWLSDEPLRDRQKTSCQSPRLHTRNEGLDTTWIWGLVEFWTLEPALWSLGEYHETRRMRMRMIRMVLSLNITMTSTWSDHEHCWDMLWLLQSFAHWRCPSGWSRSWLSQELVLA